MSAATAVATSSVAGHVSAAEYFTSNLAFPASSRRLDWDQPLVVEAEEAEAEVELTPYLDQCLS